MAMDMGSHWAGVTWCGGKGVDLGSKLSSASCLISQGLGFLVYKTRATERL